jgi:leucyl-tRNA synthetase
LPTSDGEPPLARAKREDWNAFDGDRMEYNTMPGWAGSSWYFLRYMDPHNEKAFVSKEKADYWNQVDLYIGGSEHATGHLLYSRFWTKFLFDMGFISFTEPFKKMINQGMILGRSSFVYRDKDSSKFYSLNKLANDADYQRLHVDISLVDNDKLNIDGFKNWLPEYTNSEFILDDNGTYICDHEVEKMSKSKYNVQTPDELVEKFGADTLRCYEMFLGPLEQAKPWDTKGINGVHNFLRKFWRLFHDANNNFVVSDGLADKTSLKTLHKTIKKIQDDLERYSFNTAVSNFMIATNELTEQKCNNREVLSQLLILLSPYAPHITEELWALLGNEKSITQTVFPNFDPAYLVEAEFAYPVSFNGKMRFTLPLPTNMDKEAVEKAVLENEQTLKYLDGNSPKKVIVVQGKIVNIVL